MQGYLDSKVAEYSVLFEWVETEINRLRAENKHHDKIIDRLDNKYVELQKLYGRLKSILNFNSKTMIQRALPIIHDIEYQILVITYFYIPGLQRENANDLFIRNVVLSVLQRCGIFWVDDILVRLDGYHAIFPVMTEMPVIFAIPQHVTSTVDMAAIYHELGHDVFQHFPEIYGNLSRALSEYFSQLRQSGGSMAPEKREARNKRIDSALDYWHEERLNELFSDIYGTFVCGPAHYFSCIDIAVRMRGNPFSINVADVHPPWTARINACYKVLMPTYENEDRVNTIHRVWDYYASTQIKDSNFDWLYPDDLIDLIINIAIQNIEKFVPNARRYSRSLEDLHKGYESISKLDLEDILNERLVILLSDTLSYGEWERKIFNIFETKFRPGNN